MRYIGIVGSRNRSEKKHITLILTRLSEEYSITVVSGGAKGIDTEAEKVAKSLNIPTLIYKPNMENYPLIRNEVYFERNKLIATKSEYLFAFPLDRKGGTMNTIEHFIALGKEDKLFICD